MYQLINKFIESAKEIESDVFPFLSNKINFDPKIDSVYYSGPYWDDEEITEMIHSIFKGKWLSSGEKVHKFEKQFSKKFGFNHSVMVNSGSSANLVMIAALKKYFNWQDGDEIIVCACGFATTVAPIVQNGLKPVFVDINWSDLNWELDEIGKKITDKTVAVISSPVLGNPYDIDKIVDICKENKIMLIADNCDSLGSKWDGKYLTDFAVAASCSFYPAHHLCTIEGGMVSSNIKEIVDLARSFAWWGRDCYCVGQQNLLSCGTCGKRFDSWLDGYDGIVDHKYIFSQMGYNLKPLDMQGGLGSVQLTKFEEIHKIRRKNKELIGSIMESIPGVRVVGENQRAETSWFGVPIVCDTREIKETLVSFLEENKIQTRNYFAGNILLHPGYKHLDDATKYPNANQVLNKVFFLGCSPTINSNMIDYISEVVKKYKKNRDEKYVPFYHPV
jgi:CDP-6-deoxy-D-xylo-4-hexulose-3-dehydrase